jgi:hypothetical protein
MSGVCGSDSRRFLTFSRRSPVHASRKLTAAAEHGMNFASSDPAEALGQPPQGVEGGVWLLQCL